MTEALYIYFLAAIVLDHAHLMCPIQLGWSNPGFRGIMLRRPGRYVLLPALCVSAALAIGLSVESTHDPLFRAMTITYIWWNAWHFGAQHFGIASLFGWRAGPRWLRQLAIVGTTMACLLIPVGFLPLLIVNEVMSFTHWMTDIGLTTWVMRKWWWVFLPLVMCVGLIGFVWKGVVVNPGFCAPMSACPVIWSIPALLSLRYGLGFWHFLMSRWVWRLSDQQVRATIGAELFPAR